MAFPARCLQKLEASFRLGNGGQGLHSDQEAPLTQVLSRRAFSVYCCGY